MKKVGYIGLGIMGAAMAANLRRAGFDLLVWNRTQDKAQPLLEQGAQWVESPQAMAKQQPDCICINVTDTPDVEAVLFGKEGLAASAHAGLIVIDHSTISPIATQRFARQLAEQGVLMLDAPVSGGDVGARDGTLSIMVGGEREAFDRCEPLLGEVGGAIHHVGPSGMGQTCKACNQIAVVNALQGVCEAIVLARKSGLDVAKMIEVVSAGAGGSWQLANLGQKAADCDFAPGFMVDLVLKDLAIVLETAEKLGVPSEGTRIAQHRFAMLSQLGDGRLGTQAMIKALGERGPTAPHPSDAER